MSDANGRMPGDPGYDSSTEAYNPSDPQWNQASAGSPNNTTQTPTANQAIYGPTGNPAGTPSGRSSSSSSSSSGTYTNPAANNALLNAAQQAAYQAYLNAKLNLDTEAQAFSQAQAAFSNKISEAGLTGTYQGQQTLASQKQAADIAAQTAGITGYYTAPTYTPGGGTSGWQAPTADQYIQARTQQLVSQQGFDPTRAQQTAVAEWNQNLPQQGNVAYGMPSGISFTAPAATAGAPGATAQGTPTLAREAQQQKTTLDYLNLISGQRGPQDYAQYLRTLGSTPGGLRDLVSSAAGQYVPAAGATTGVAPVGASVGGLVNSAATGASAGTTYQDYMNQTSGLPAPNQISPAAMNAYTSSQKQLLLGAYQAQGWQPQDVQDLYNQSLPRYAYSSGTTGTVKI